MPLGGRAAGTDRRIRFVALFGAAFPGRGLRTLSVIGMLGYLYLVLAPVAQLDRASDYGSEGWGFESLRACCGKAP